jgi:stress response protein YsnF
MRGTDDSFGTDVGMTSSYDWEGRELIDKDGDRVGVVASLYAYGDTDVPTWAAVRTGRFGGRETFVPIAAAQPAGERVRVPFTKELIRNAPSSESWADFTRQQESALYSHYGMTHPSVGVDDPAPLPAERPTSAVVEHGAQERASDDAMTRSEEEMRVDTVRRERGRVRLRKFVVTEEVRERVRVQREEARIEREPITEENIDAAMAGPEISTAEHEIVLHEEVPVVEKRVVPKERVRLEKETHTDEEQISEQIRKERIEADEELDR